MHPAFTRTDHRPWPVPERPWTWRQSWRSLLFAHWPVPAAAVRRLVPAPLTVQEFGGTSWIGIVPFRMEGVTRRPFPSLPWISAFPELNLRLYVEHDGKPGVWFLSLDAANPVAVWAARKWFFLPYSHARMGCSENGESVRFFSERIGQSIDAEGKLPVRFAAEYAPTSEPSFAEPGTLEHWLTERYCLYARSPDGCLFRAEVHHQPWPLQRADAAIQINDLPVPFGLPVELFECRAPLLHFSRRLDVVVWPLERLTERCRSRKLTAIAARPAFHPA